MKKFMLILCCCLFFVSCDTSTDQANSLEGNGDDSNKTSSLGKQSYAIGYDISKGFSDNGIKLDIEQLKKGLVDGNAKRSKYTDEELQKFLTDFRVSMMQQQQEKQREVGMKNKKESEAFFAKNANEKGVITTDSGLQYKIISNGSGRKPKASDTVEVHYRGELLDGNVFDSSYERGAPATFPVANVISGWTEALQLMPVGSKWILYIDSELGYGERGAGAKIGPNAALIFEVELLDIK